MYIKSMDAVWKHNYGYTGQYRDKIRDVIEDFKLKVEVKLLSWSLSLSSCIMRMRMRVIWRRKA